MLSAKSFSAILQEWAEVSMHRSARNFKRFMDDTGLSPSQVNTLMRLHHGGPCGISDVGEHTGISNAAASQMVDRLVQMGLVERTEAQDDRRAKQLSLTPDGHALFQQAFHAQLAWMEALTGALTGEQQETIASALSVLTDAARRLEDIG